MDTDGGINFLYFGKKSIQFSDKLLLSGAFIRGAFIRRGFRPAGILSGEDFVRGAYIRGVFVRGAIVRRAFVLDPHILPLFKNILLKILIIVTILHIIFKTKITKKLINHFIMNVSSNYVFLSGLFKIFG